MSSPRWELAWPGYDNVKGGEPYLRPPQPAGNKKGAASEDRALSPAIRLVSSHFKTIHGSANYASIRRCFTIVRLCDSSLDASKSHLAFTLPKRKSGDLRRPSPQFPSLE
jgi:hypothetical protein